MMHRGASIKKLHSATGNSGMISPVVVLRKTFIDFIRKMVKGRRMLKVI
jgi:hypothetical protein